MTRYLAGERLEDRITPVLDPFVAPPVIASAGGLLRTALIQAIGPAVVGDQPVTDAWSYNGSYVGPTLAAQPGDLLDIELHNDLPQVTNLHTHGLHVSPLGNGDNVLLQIEPGTENHYEIQIPADHPQGLYWYHPHHHGQVNNQIIRGLSGLLTVGRPDGGAPELNGLTQQVLALKNAVLDGTSITNPSTVDVATETFTVNGQLNPLLTMRPGERQVFNVANIGNNAFYLLALVNGSGVRQQLRAVAEDGNPFTVVGNPGGDPTLLGMPPGRRWSFVVVGGNAGEQWTLQTLGFNDGFNNWPAKTLMTVRFAGTPVVYPNPLPTTLTPPTNYYRDLRGVPVAAHRTVVFDQGPNAAGVFQFTINGGVFPNNPVFQPRLGTVEEWELLNVTTDVHPFHLHTNPQQVVSAQNQPNGLGLYQDVINVPARNATTGAPGRVVIRVEFLDYLGTIVYHCHRVDHEDDGMMALVNMVPNQPVNAVGAGPTGGPVAVEYQSAGNIPLATLAPFGAQGNQGIHVAVGDVNMDGVSDYAFGAGPGGGPRVVVLDGRTGASLYSFFAYETSFAGGVAVAVGDVNADGYGDIITGAGQGGGPLVRAFSGKDGSLLLSFLAYAATFRGGVTVAAGDPNGDGRTDIVTGAGPGGGPHVKQYRVEANHGTGGDPFHVHLELEFFAFDPSFTGGVTVAVGWATGIGFPDIIVGAGPTGGPRVNVYNILSAHDGATGAHGHGTTSTPHDLTTPELMESFFAFDQSFTGGVWVGVQSAAVGDNLVVGAGVGGGPEVRVFDANLNPLANFFAFAPTFRGGVRLG